MILYLMVASSFFWGHQEPAANIVSLPGLTRILILDQTEEERPRINPRAGTRNDDFNCPASVEIRNVNLHMILKRGLSQPLH